MYGGPVPARRRAGLAAVAEPFRCWTCASPEGPRHSRDPLGARPATARRRRGWCRRGRSVPPAVRGPPRYDDVARIGAGAYAAASAWPACGPTTWSLRALRHQHLRGDRQFETLGFCGEGEGVDYLAEAGVGLDGRHPTNTDGGLMAYSHVGWGGPTLKIIEAVRQIRDTAGPSQVPGAEVALVTGAGSGAQYHNAVLLGADR